MEATTIYEPRGDHGLEGYQLGDIIKCEKLKNKKTGKCYFRVYPIDTLTGGVYYETCTPIVFKKYFRIRGAA